jgi:phosphatidylinositol-3-phosphatase
VGYWNSVKYRRVLTALACAALAWIPAQAQSGLRTVFVIVLENHNWSQVKDAANAPYLNNTLLPHAAHAEQYYTPPGNHPSLPNYLWLEAGTNFGIRDDNDPSSNHQKSPAHLVTQLRNSGISWKAYQEDIDGRACPLTRVRSYAPKHNPFVYFEDVTNSNDTSSAYCTAHVRPLTELANDLKSDAVAQYVFITPSLCSDGHDSCAPVNDPARQTDNWLAVNVPAILNSGAYQNGGALFITWDEGDNDSDGPLGLVLLSPYAKDGGYSNVIRYTHGSLLRTVEEIFGMSPLAAAASQPDLGDLFRVPIDLTAVAGSGQVALHWSAVTGAVSYSVRRGTGSGGPYSTVVASGLSKTSYTDTTAVNGATYYYVVTSLDGSGESLPSNQAIAWPAAPAIVSAAINGASFRSPGVVAPGSIVTVFGSGFGSKDSLAAFPATSVNGVSVLFGSTPAPIFAVADGQINVLAPTELPTTGTMNLTVQNAGGGSVPLRVNLAPAAPGLFFYSDPKVSTRRNAVALTANTAWIAMPLSMAASLELPTNCSVLGPTALCAQPAHPGDSLQIYVTGLGKATPNGDPSGAALLTGNVAPVNGTPLYRTIATPTVTIGGLPAEVQFSGITPGYSGLYQVNVSIPANVAPGDYVPLQIMMAGVSDSATIAVQ